MTLTGRRAALKLALTSVHFLLWLRLLLTSWLRCLWSVRHHLTKHKGTKLCHIVADARRLDKLPFHLALVIGEDKLSMADLANVVCWAVAAGVQFISLYDPKGESVAINVLYVNTRTYPCTCTMYLCMCTCTFLDRV